MPATTFHEEVELPGGRRLLVAVKKDGSISQIIFRESRDGKHRDVRVKNIKRGIYWYASDRWSKGSGPSARDFGVKKWVALY